jgi:CHAD domain-containing protein
MRVAARHLRALLAAFEDCLDKEAVAFLRGELSWLQHRLAPARDWDVFITKSLAPFLSDDPGFAWLLAAARGKRERAYAAAQAALNHRRYARLILRFRFWLDSLDFADPGRQKVDSVMAGYLRAHFRKLLQGLRQGGLSDLEMHRLRLRMKKVSDIGELAKPLYRGARRRRFMRRLSKLQASLGQRQDAVVARQLALVLGKLAPEAAQRTIAAIVGAETTRIAEQASRFDATCARLFRLKRFWRKSA